MKYNVLKGNEVVKKNLSKKQAEEYCDKMNKEFMEKQESIRKQQHNAGLPLRKSKYELYKVEVVKESKIIRLTESDLVRIVKRVINEGILDDMIKNTNDEINKTEQESKKIVLRTILNRSNHSLNKVDKIQWDGDILKLKYSIFEFGQGTILLPILKRKKLFTTYIIDFKNKKLYDKNFLGGEFDLTDDELDEISNKFYRFK